MKPGLAEALAEFSGFSADTAGITLSDAEQMPAIARQLSDAGHYRWRREDFDIRAEPEGRYLPGSIAERCQASASWRWGCT